MRREFEELPGWTFGIDEVSAGVYEVIGRDDLGHLVTAKGVDLDVLVEECRQEALAILLRPPSSERP